MNVTKSNFLSVLKEMEILIPRSEFIVLDEEMTGVRIPGLNTSFFDATEEAYSKQRQFAEKYGLLQVGLCLFEKSSSESDVYTARPFNFYVFPSDDRTFADHSFSLSMESGGIAFNCMHNMDFQKWVYEGVRYCNQEVESKYRAHVEEKMAPSTANIVLKDESSKERAAKILEIIDNWMKNSFASDSLILPQENDRIIQKFVEIETLKKTDAYYFSWQRRNWTISKSQGLDLKRQAEERILNFTGFREIFKLLVKHRKPLVGHMIMGDLVFLIDSFDKETPKTLSEFRSYMSDHFPVVWDTKVLSCCDEEVESLFQYTGLQKIFEYFVDSPVVKEQTESDSANDSASLRRSILYENPLPCVEFPIGFERYTAVFNSRKRSRNANLSLAHEAAYDALCTGYVYIQLRELLKAEKYDSCKNHIAMFKHLLAINTSTDGSPSRKLSEGHVLKLSYSTSNEIEVQASLNPLKGRVEWRENNTAAAVLSSIYTAEEGLKHYESASNSDIKAELFL